jgi:hypothetical protein
MPTNDQLLYMLISNLHEADLAYQQTPTDDILNNVLFLQSEISRLQQLKNIDRLPYITGPL